MGVEDELRAQLVRLGAAIFDRRLTPGRTGNLSVRIGDQILITPTGSCLGSLDPDRLSVTSTEGDHLSGDPPSKELALHRVLYRHHPRSFAVAHLHSTAAVAASSLVDPHKDDPLPAITPYFAMRVGTLAVADYAAPGSPELEQQVSSAAHRSRALLLRNHGSLLAAATLEDAVDGVEEIEETARLYFMLQGHSPTFLSPAQVSELQHRFPSTA